jgi:serine/threonine-protein kinase RsbW
VRLYGILPIEETASMVTMRWQADVDQLGAIRDFVAEAGRSLGAGERAILDLQLAVDEICSNSVRHGYGGREGQIEVTVERAGQSIEVVVRDWGRAFDPDQVPKPALDIPLEERSLGGLGLYLVRQVMDDVRFEFDRDRGNSVTMVKRLNGEGELR